MTTQQDTQALLDHFKQKYPALAFSLASKAALQVEQDDAPDQLLVFEHMGCTMFDPFSGPRPSVEGFKAWLAA